MCVVCGNIVDLVQQMKCYTMVIMEVDCIPMCQYVSCELCIYPSRYFILLWRPICYLDDVIKTPTNNYCYFCVWKELYGLCVHVFFYVNVSWRGLSKSCIAPLTKVVPVQVEEIARQQIFLGPNVT